MAKLANPNVQNPEMAVKIKNDLVDYFKFIDLIQKERPDEAQQEIETYIKTELNVLKRIAFIEELDKRSTPSSVTPVELIGENKFREKKKKNLKFTVSSYFNFLFHTRKVIKAFGKKNHVLASRFLSLKISSDSESYYKKLLEKANTFALPAVTYLLKHGWEQLDKKSYNVVTVFAEFLKQFALNGNILARSDSKRAVFKIEAFIEPYLRVIESKDNIEILKDGLYKILYPIPSFYNQFKDLIGYIGELTSIEAKGLYLSNIILAAYMLHYKQNMEIDDLLEYYSIQAIDETSYDYNSSVLQNIRTKLSDLEDKHREAEREVFFLKFLEENLEADTDNKSLVTLFKKIYYQHQTDPSTRIEHSQETVFLNTILDGDFTISFLHFARGFLNLYEEFLKGLLQVKSPEGTEKTSIIFKNNLFADERKDLGEAITELGTLKSLAPYLSVSLSTLNKYFYFGKTDTQKEIRFCDILKKIIATFYSIGDKAITILYNHHITKNLTGSEKLEVVKRQDMPIEAIDNTAKLLPCAMYRLENESDLQGQLLSNILSEIAIFSLNFAHLFKYQPITIRLIKKQKFIEITEEYYKIKSKMRDFQTKNPISAN